MSNGPPLRIEMLIPSLPRAGMEMVTATLTRALAQRGHEVGLTCTEPPGELGAELRSEGFRVTEVPAPGLRPNFDARELGPWLQQVRPDVVHAHSGLWLKAAHAARSAAVPRVVLTLHGIAPSEPWFMRHYHRIAASRADVVVAVSPSLQQYLVDRARVPAAKVCVITNGVPTEHYCAGERSAALRRALRIPEQAPLVGTVARLHPVKNQQLLLDAFASVRERVHGAHLVIVGDGPLRPELERRILELGIADRVRITGLVTDSAPYLRDMDVFVLSSHIEGLSVSLLEAMASEVPVVATAVGGNPGLLQHGALGRLTPAGDASALADAIAATLLDREASAATARVARATVEAQHSVASMVHAYEEVYRNGRAAGAGSGMHRLAERR